MLEGEVVKGECLLFLFVGGFETMKHIASKQEIRGELDSSERIFLKCKNQSKIILNDVEKVLQKPNQSRNWF